MRQGNGILGQSLNPRVMSRLRRTFLVYALALTVAGVAYGGWHIYNNHRSALQSAHTTLQVIARSMRQQLMALVTDGLGTGIATYRHLDTRGFEDGEYIARVLSENLSEGAYITGAFLAVPGRYVQVERNLPPSIQTTWPDWLACQKTVCVGVPLRTPDRYVLPIIQRVQADGVDHFVGALLDIHELQRSWRAIDLPHGRYALVREDGMFLTRAAEDEPDDLLLEPPRDIAASELFESMARVGAQAEIIEGTSPYSQLELVIAAIRADEEVPVILAAGLPRSAVLARWRTNTRDIALLTAGGISLLLVITALLYRFLRLLNERERQFLQLFNESHSSILLLRDGRVLYANAITNEIFDVPEGDTIVGKAPWEFSPPTQPDGESSEVAANRKFGALDDTPHLRFRWLHRRLKTGEPFEAEVSLSRLRTGEHEYMLGIIHDISGLMRAQRALHALNETLEQRVKERTQGLEAANARLNAINAELEEFTASASHDLRSPMSTISGQTALIEAALGPRASEPDIAPRFAKIHAGVQRAAEVIDGLLSLAHITRQELRSEEVSLSALVQHLVAELREAEPDRQVALHCQEGITVVADPRLMHSLLQNLIGNAWKYSKNRTPAIIEFGRDESGYFVRDNGLGFDMEHAARLFRAFQRLHSQAEVPGTGIGLATAARIVRRYGGRIWAQAEVNKGATFYFTLPGANRKDK
jgi:PAS domain S-box-containing protein